MQSEMRNYTQTLEMFRINERFVERTGGEIAAYFGFSPAGIGMHMAQMVRAGLVEADDSVSKTTIYRLTPKGRRWLSQQPLKRGKVLTAVPK